jgi:hypothetical protein
MNTDQTQMLSDLCSSVLQGFNFLFLTNNFRRKINGVLANYSSPQRHESLHRGAQRGTSLLLSVRLCASSRVSVVKQSLPRTFSSLGCGFAALRTSIEKKGLCRESRSRRRGKLTALFDFEQPSFDFLLGRKRVLRLGLSLERSGLR